MSTEWIVEIEALGGAFAATEINERLDALVDELSAFAGVVTGSPEKGMSKFGAALTVKASDPTEACIVANEAFSAAVKKADLPNEPVFRCEIRTLSSLERDLEEPTYPQFVGIQELASTLQVTKQRASELARASHFPRPVAELASGPIWAEPTIQNFIADWDRRPGRPRTREESPNDDTVPSQISREGVTPMSGRRTGSRAAKAASKVLRSGSTGKASKTAAASALSQRSKGGSRRGKK